MQSKVNSNSNLMNINIMLEIDLVFSLVTVIEFGHWKDT